MLRKTYKVITAINEKCRKRATMDDDETARSRYLTGKGKRRVKRTSKNENEDISGQPSTDEDHTQNRDDPSVKTQDDAGMKELRLLARQKYLHHREKQKLELFAKELEYLEDDVVKYGWENLTQQERDEITLKRELLQIINNRNNDGVQKFNMQDEYINNEGKLDVKRKRDLLNYRGTDVRETKLSRQHMWEENQLNKAVIKENLDEVNLPDADKYDFVFDDDAMIDYEDNEEVMPEKDSEYDNHLIERLQKEQDRITSIQEMRKLLPVYSYRNALLEAIREHQTLIVVGETGSGKTTQLPQYLLEDGYTKGGKLRIAVTQPRRVAATAVAARVADEMDVVLGKEVGYSIRFEDKTTEGKTVLKYMTDGMLLREFLEDPELKKYSCIMIDEAHERTLATDILLGLLKDILPHRKDMKLVISSATMNATKFSRFFNNCPIFNVPGRRYPVDIRYTVQPEANYIHAAISTVLQIHTKEPLPGDILVFLTGQEEIESIKEKLEQITEKMGSSIAPLIITPNHNLLAHS